MNGITKNGAYISNLKETRHEFVTFYSNLYKREKEDQKIIVDYLEGCKVAKIPGGKANTLNGPITMAEVQQALNQTKLSKAPGPAIFYKKFQDELVLPPKDIMNRVLISGQIPESWKAAYITLIPKEDKDQLKPENY